MYSDVLVRLEQNPIEIYNETSRLLVKIAENILKSPSNQKIRSLQRSNETISKKILSVPGAIDCLKLMGFEEDPVALTLPLNKPLKNLETLKNEMMKRKADTNISKGTGQPEETTKVPETSNNNDSKRLKIDETDNFKKVVLPPLVHMFSNEFLRKLEVRFHRVLTYEDKDLQARALAYLPLKQMEINAQKKLRDLQEQIKKVKNCISGDKDSEISFQDFMILELLHWFKNDFFEWVDVLNCEKCGGKSEEAGTSTDSELLAFANRVELHKCVDCNHLTHFGRFNDLNILLETRRGRCGEWANTFMLFCRALGWDTRFIFDEQDHVWTEVFSYGQNRWLHCDPCEAACDTPLIYENGWGKTVSYVTAFSCDEVQDVTWRYSSKHANVLSRRDKSTEEELISAIMRMREVRQRGVSEARRKYLAKRCLTEVVEMMVERNPSNNDSQGRTSGSLAWKLSRGESGLIENASYIWSFTEDDLKNNEITLKYSASLDQYELKTAMRDDVVNKWHRGVYETKNVIRKEEKDWKMVYICHKENSTEGFATWKFEISDGSFVFDMIDIKMGHKLFEIGNIDVKLSSDKQCLILKPSDLSKHQLIFSGETSFTLTAVLKGRKSWQHAQLFRQSLDDDDCPFIVNITFKSKK